MLTYRHYSTALGWLASGSRLTLGTTIRSRITKLLFAGPGRLLTCWACCCCGLYLLCISLAGRCWTGRYRFCCCWCWYAARSWLICCCSCTALGLWTCSCCLCGGGRCCCCCCLGLLSGCCCRSLVLPLFLLRLAPPRRHSHSLALWPTLPQIMQPRSLGGGPLGTSTLGLNRYS